MGSHLSARATGGGASVNQRLWKLHSNTVCQTKPEELWVGMCVYINVVYKAYIANKCTITSPFFLFSAMGSLFSGAILKKCTKETKRQDRKLLDYVWCQN